MPTAGIRAVVGSTFAIVALTLLGITVALATSAILAFRWLVDRRIHRLSGAMAKIATTNDYSLRVQDGSSDELGMMMRNFDEIATENSGKLVVRKLDVDSNPETTRRYGVLSIPSMLLFVDGVEKARIVGARGKAQILSELSQYLA